MIGEKRHGVLLAACVGCFCGGSAYMFGVYASQLKAAIGCTQEQLNVIGSGSFIFGSFFFFLFPVQVWSRAKYTYGLQTLWVGLTLLGFIGHFMIWLVLGGYVTANWALVGVMMGFTGMWLHGSFALTVSIVPDHFPARRTVVLASLQVFYGLGNVLWPLVYRYALGNNLLHEFLMLSVLPPLTGLLNFMFIRHVERIEDLSVADVHGKASFVSPIQETRGLAVEAVDDDTRRRMSSSASYGTSPLMDTRTLADSEADDQTMPTVADIETHLLDHEVHLSPVKVVFTLGTRFEFYLFVLVFFVLFGTTTNGLNNASSLIGAYGGNSDDMFFPLVIFGVFQTMARITCSIWGHYKIDPLGLLLLSIMLQTAANFAAYGYATQSSILGYIWTSGYAYGLCWTCFFACAFHVFRDIAAHPEVIAVIYQFCPGLGVLCFGLFSGYVYDHHGYIETDGSVQCVGAQCYRSTYLSFAVTGVIAMLGLLGMYVRVRRRFPYAAVDG